VILGFVFCTCSGVNGYLLGEGMAYREERETILRKRVSGARNASVHDVWLERRQVGADYDSKCGPGNLSGSSGWPGVRDTNGKRLIPRFFLETVKEQVCLSASKRTARRKVASVFLFKTRNSHGGRPTELRFIPCVGRVGQRVSYVVECAYVGAENDTSFEGSTED
jgi:hypothetical protein